ncbi:MAG: multidrug ABC transporter ATP-binding protein [Anaerolineaceae bacterium 4572_5.1]|nr:MAG: multidrug ABC transporter ATP-binding protein [Anaerolineaceae bacterium 4572_5.1]
MDIPSGEVFGFLGPNGAGKTTTIRMLGALLAPTEGEAWVAGFQVGKNNQKIRRNIGLLPETPGLYTALSAERNLSFYGTMYGVENLDSQIKRYLDMLGLWGRRHEPVGTFSKGMRQKLAIARAVLHEPKVLLLDEPTSGLDPQMARLVREFISELKKEGRTILLSTHNLEEADRLCDRVAVFQSHLLALDTPLALRQQLFGRKVVFHLAEMKPQYQSILEKFDFIQEIQTIEEKLVITLENPEENNPVLVKVLVQAGADVQFIGELRRSLEDVYLQLVQNQ